MLGTAFHLKAHQNYIYETFTFFTIDDCCNINFKRT